jgi:ribosome-associated protein
MLTFQIKGGFIQLNQLLKALSWVENGAQANSLIEQGRISVNGMVEYRKRNKLVAGDKVRFNDREVELYE